MKKSVLLVVLSLSWACETPPPPPVMSHVPTALQACAAAGGSVGSIEEAVVRLNSLPRPVDVPCFVASLPRPFSIVATTAITSAQPAAGKENPRVFLLLPGIALSVVPSGAGAKLVEFGQWMTSTRTLKGELELPITSTLEADAPFKHVLFGSPATSCALCHPDEEPHPTIPNAYVTVAFKPLRQTLVQFSALEALHQACVEADDPSERCALFHAIFDFGDVKAGAFAAEVATISQ